MSIKDATGGDALCLAPQISAQWSPRCRLIFDGSKEATVNGRTRELGNATVKLRGCLQQEVLIRRAQQENLFSQGALYHVRSELK